MRIRMSKQKSYNTKVVGNTEINLLVKGNFKRSTECDNLKKIVKNIQTSVQNLEDTAHETRNRAWEWNLLIDLHIFRVQLFSNRILVV